MLLKDQDKNKDRNSEKDSRDKRSNYMRKIDSYDESKEQNQSHNSLLQFNIQKLLNQSAQKQEKYIKYLQQQRQQLFMVTEKYASTMAQYKKQIKQFIMQKQNAKNRKIYEKVHRMANKVPTNKYDKKQYTLQSQYQLNCRINFHYMIPVVQDYLKQVFPNKLYIQFMQYYPSRDFKQIQVQLSPDIDEEDRLQLMRNGNPFDILTVDNKKPVYNFLLSHFNQKFDGAKVLRYYRENQLQLMIRDVQSQLILGYGKVDLEQFLQFNSENEQNWVQKIPIVSLEGSDRTIAFLNIELINSSVQKTISKQHIHKISQPITLQRNQIKFYNDKQSRIIQRINQYKNNHNNIIPTMSRQGADKNILMHQKRKQLEQIQHYKQAHKSQYMQKIFGEAIEQYHTQYLQVGQCKYIPFIYSNHTEKLQKIKIRLSYHRVRQQKQSGNELNMQLNETNRENNFASVIKQDESISFEMVDPMTTQVLFQQHIIETNQKLQNCTKEYAIQDGYTYVVNGESIVIFVKAVCHTLVTSGFKYQVSVQLYNDYGQNLHTDMIMLKVCMPVPTHIFPLYCYVGEINEIKIQTPSFKSNRAQSSLIGKAKIANIIGHQSVVEVENHWSQQYQILQLRLKILPKIQLNKIFKFYIFVYDIHYTLLLASYQFLLQCMQKLQQQQIQIGRTNTFNFKVKFPLLQNQTNNPNQQFITQLSTSDFLSSYTRIFNTQKNTRQFVATKNVQYPITLNYNTFNQKPPTQRLIVSFVDYTTKKSIKKLALPIKKNSLSYKRVYKLNCLNNRILPFNIQISCPYAQSTTYKLYSSNYSLMTIPIDTLLFMPNQVQSIKLEFRYWQKLTNSQFETENNQRHVILGVDDGKSCLLYLFQLLPIEND